MRREVMRVAVGAVAVLLGACGSGPVGVPGPVPFGTWGGLGIQMEVSASGAKVSHLNGCTGAVISQPLIMDSNGRFEVDGVYSSPAFWGPGTGRSWSALFSGRVRGSSMDLTVSESDGSRLSYQLTHGVRGTHEGVVC